MPKIVIDTSVPVAKNLRTLLRTGLYGQNIGETAERLICKQLIQMAEREEELGKTVPKTQRRKIL